MSKRVFEKAMGKRCTGKQKGHACRACGQTGHRLETCTSWAAAEIRRLRKVADCAKKPAKERSFRRPRKTGKHRAEAKSKYTGDQPRRAAQVVKRSEVLGARRLAEDVEGSYEELLRKGYCAEATQCGHCGSGSVSRCKGKRGGQKGHLFISCSRCKRYTNVLWHSAFRGTRMSPNMLLETLNVYAHLNLLSRPKAAEINRQTGFGLHLGSPVVTFSQNRFWVYELKECMWKRAPLLLSICGASKVCYSPRTRCVPAKRKPAGSSEELRCSPAGARGGRRPRHPACVREHPKPFDPDTAGSQGRCCRGAPWQLCVAVAHPHRRALHARRQARHSHTAKQTGREEGASATGIPGGQLLVSEGFCGFLSLPHRGRMYRIVGEGGGSRQGDGVRNISSGRTFPARESWRRLPVHLVGRAHTSSRMAIPPTKGVLSWRRRKTSSALYP